MCDTYTPDQMLSEILKHSEILMNCLGNAINRQIITVLSPAGQNGMRVPEITAKTFLSRPSVTSHLKELQKAGLVRVHHAGTKNYYYLYISDNSLHVMEELLNSLTDYYHMQDAKI